MADAANNPIGKPDDADTSQLVLMKREHRWVFRYRAGEEADVLRGLADVAGDPDVDFDWFDAAVLSHQMGDAMHKQLKNMMPG